MKTVTGKLMSSGRMIADQAQQDSRVTNLQQSNEMLWAQISDLRDRIEQLQVSCDRSDQRFSHLLSMWLTRHPSEAVPELLAHPDNLANWQVQDHERAGC